jgi:hypothetical protein
MPCGEETLLQAGDLRHAMDRAVQRLLRERRAVDREEQTRLRRVRFAQHVRPRFGQVLADEVRGDLAERHDAILFELPLKHRHVTAIEVDVADAKAQQFQSAPPCG